MPSLDLDRNLVRYPDAVPYKQRQQRDRDADERGPGSSQLDALLENLEKALGRRPVKIGEEGKEVYVYRGDVANNALKMAGSELGLFTDKSGVTHRPSHYDDLSDADLVRKLRDEALLLLEYHEREAGEADGNAEVPRS